MWVAVHFSDVSQIKIPELNIGSSLYFKSAIGSSKEVKYSLRLILVDLRSTASRSISFQAPSLSRILAIFGASWIPAPTNPKFEAVSKTSIWVKPFFASARAQASPPIPDHVLERHIPPRKKGAYQLPQPQFVDS